MLVIAPHVAATSALWDLPSDLPIVAVEAGPQEGVPVVAVDQYQGARLATEHLLAQGHATVHHLSGPLDWIEAQQPRRGLARRAGGGRRAQLDAAAGRLEPALRATRWGAGCSSAPTSRRSSWPTTRWRSACCAASHEQGRGVPADVSVVGFDDIPEAEFFTPAADDGAPGLHEMGRRGVALLLEEIGSPQRSGTRVTVPATLVERASTAAPSPSART